MTNRKMRLSSALVGLFSVAWPFSASAERGKDGESSYYVFSSGHLVAGYKSGYLPVLYGDKRGVYVDTDRGIKRLRYSAACKLIPKVGISDQVVTIAEAKYGFDNLKQSRLESDAVSEMMKNEAATERSILMKGGGIAGMPPEGLSEEIQSEINQMKEVQSETNEFVQESLENDAYGRGELSDIINVRFNLFPEKDVDNVYCAMVVRYLQRDPKNPSQFSRAKVARMKKIGNLDTGRPNKVRFSYPLPEGFVNDRGIELFFFSGDGKPLATNQSRNLRPLTPEESREISP